MLPSLTTFVFWARPAFLALSICVPIACVAFLFARDVARSLSFIGALILISILQSAILYQALWSPLGKIVEKMQQ